ncbi:hypothetical protein ACF0H5_012358 [Mactra antiquata]
MNKYTRNKGLAASVTCIPLTGSVFPLLGPEPEIPGIQEDGMEEDEVMEEEMVTVETSEQEFVFREFAVKFAKPEILKAYVLLLGDFQKNSTHTNHCCVKMLHRIAVDLGYIGMMFQISLFRVFQKILLSPLVKAGRYKEICKFATYIVRKFVEVATNNKKIFMELLFWKSNKDAIEVVEGYGSYQSKGKTLWTEDAEAEVRRLFEEYRINEEADKDTVDCIMERITDPSKTRGQIIRELKRQELIESAKDLKKPKSGSRGGAWREEDELELQELYEKYKHSDDPVGSIMSEMCKKRSRPKIMEKLLSMGLVSDRKELYKKRGKSGGRSRRGDNSDSSDNEGPTELPSDFEEPDLDGEPRHGSDNSGSSRSDSDTGDDDDDDDNDNASSGSSENMSDVIKGLVNKGYKDQIAWIQRLLNRTATDREEEDEDVGVPIVPLTEENETAMDDEMFLSFLSKIGIASPADEQEVFWRIPSGVSPADLRNAASGLVLDENDEPVNADRIKVHQSKPKKKQKKQKKKKLKKSKPKKNANKIAALKELIKAKKQSKKTKRTRNKVSVDQSDDMTSPDRNNIENQSDGSSTKKKRIQVVSGSDSDSEDNMPLKSLDSADYSSDPGSPIIPVIGTQQSPRSVAGTQQSPTSTAGTQQSRSSSQKKRRLKPVLRSDSDSEDDIPLKSIISGTQSSQEVEDGNESDKENQSQDSESQPLLFLSSSDEETEGKTRDHTEDRPSSQASKRSRSSESDTELNLAKKARLDDSKEPVESVPTETFPATLYTQGTESDSDLDDHVPLRKVIQKKNIIESDED